MNTPPNPAVRAAIEETLAKIREMRRARNYPHVVRSDNVDAEMKFRSTMSRASWVDYCAQIQGDWPTERGDEEC